MTSALNTAAPSIRMRFDLVNVAADQWADTYYQTAVELHHTTYNEKQMVWRTSGGLVITAKRSKMVTVATLYDPDEEHREMVEFACNYPPAVSNELYARLSLPPFQAAVGEYEMLNGESEPDDEISHRFRAQVQTSAAVLTWSEPCYVSDELALALFGALAADGPGLRSVVWLEVSQGDHDAIRAMERKVETVADFNVQVRIHNIFAKAHWEGQGKLPSTAPSLPLFLASRPSSTGAVSCM